MALYNYVTKHTLEVRTYKFCFELLDNVRDAHSQAMVFEFAQKVEAWLNAAEIHVIVKPVV